VLVLSKAVRLTTTANVALAEIVGGEANVNVMAVPGDAVAVIVELATLLLVASNVPLGSVL
jgi:hypothetical protein